MAYRAKDFGFSVVPMPGRLHRLSGGAVAHPERRADGDGGCLNS